MRNFITTVSLCLLACILCCCKGNQTSNGQENNSQLSIVNSQLVYAQGFAITNLSDGVRLIDIQDPQAEESTAWHFALVPKELKSYEVPQEYTVVRTPVSKAICMTMLQLADFIALNALDQVSGITRTRNLFNEDVLQRVKDGKIFQIGSEGDFDAEVIMAANPDVIFISPSREVDMKLSNKRASLWCHIWDIRNCIHWDKLNG